MKMEHALLAPFEGTVVALKAHEGAQVQVEALLARVERNSDLIHLRHSRESGSSANYGSLGPASHREIPSSSR
jgi:pyruvate/2-oxoglutarate dehydrogenase complex dihydrolipoamide acyltransferase (E2) component